MSTRKVAMLLASMMLSLLVSCGGSGGDGVAITPPTPTPNTAALPITADNAQDITVTVLEAITATIEIIDVVDVIGLPMIGATDPGVMAAAAIGDITETVACDSGEATLTWHDNDSDLVISTGDSFDIAFAMCFFADSDTTLDGVTTLTGILVTGDPFNQIAPWQLAMTFGFDNLSGTDSLGTVTLDGSLDVDLSSVDNLIIELAVATASLTAEQSGVTETLTDFVLNQTVDLNASTSTINANGVLNSTLLEGSVTFETLQDFIVIGDENPFVGQLLISDGTSSVLVTVLDNISVQLEVDVDLNGTIDHTFVVTWVDLDID